MITFTVSDVASLPGPDPLDADAALRTFLARPVEDLRVDARRLVYCGNVHAFAQAAHEAFYLHRPLVIRPDDVWFCIAQGFARHLRLHGETLRDRLVGHPGQERLLVNRQDFRLGQPNPWPEAFEAFGEQIARRVGIARDIASARFSTTTPMESAAFDVCLMDAFQGCFRYEMRIGCGIPRFSIAGTPGDWLSMVERTKGFVDLGLEDWVRALHPVLRQIAETAAGRVDLAFWRSFFRYESGSGPAELTGWILTLFPYLIVGVADGTLGPNPYLSQWQARFEAAERRGHLRFDVTPEGPGIGALPGSVASAPLSCQVEGADQAVPLMLVAGQFGVDEDPDTGMLSTVFGWAVVHDVPPIEPPSPWEDIDDGGIDEVTGQTRSR